MKTRTKSLEKISILPDRVKNFSTGLNLNTAKIAPNYTDKSEDGYAYAVDGAVRYYFELVPSGNKTFTKSKTSGLSKNVYNTALDSLLFRMRATDMNPVYQRGLVWDIKAKRNLIDALVQGRSIGAITFAKNDYRDDFLYEIVDGKQRLSTIAEFVADGFDYQGVYFSELTQTAQSEFLNTSLGVIDVSFSDEKEKIAYFIELNSAGVKVSDEFLENLKKRLN